MSLRIGFDMDGVIADFGSAYRDVEVRLFGHEPGGRPDHPEKEERAQETSLHDRRRRQDRVWEAIRSTPDFWGQLRPLDPGAVARIHAMMLKHHWEVFFITQRPATDGATVQRQTQHWLVQQGFDLPSVLVIGGSRGAAAAAMRLDYLIDDSPQNCLDVLADSRAKPILIVGDDDPVALRGARRLRITAARNIGDALDIIERGTLSRPHVRLLDKLLTLGSKLLGPK